MSDERQREGVVNATVFAALVTNPLALSENEMAMLKQRAERQQGAAVAQEQAAEPHPMAALLGGVDFGVKNHVSGGADVGQGLQTAQATPAVAAASKARTTPDL